MRPFLSRGLVDFIVALAPARVSTDLGNLYGYDLCRGSTPSPKQLKIRCSTGNPPFVVPSKLLVTQQHPVCGTISARRAIPLRGLRLGSPFSAKGSLDCCEGMVQSFPTLACILSTDRRCMFMFVDKCKCCF